MMLWMLQMKPFVQSFSAAYWTRGREIKAFATAVKNVTPFSLKVTRNLSPIIVVMVNHYLSPCMYDSSAIPDP